MIKHFEANSPHARDIATLVHPNTNVKRHEELGPTIVNKGSGVYVYGEDGKPMMEAAAGLWCASLGFGSERLAKVAYDVIKNLGYYHLYRGVSNDYAIDLASKLIELAPVPMSKVLLQCSGSEATDTAIKLVWYHWNAQGQPEKRKIIGRIGGYHGSSIASISVAGKFEFHKGFGLPLPGFLHTEQPYYYRNHLEGETEEQFSARLCESLEKMILDEGPETVAAFWAEPVMGAGGGIIPPKGYFEGVQKILKKYDILFVADEVICGFGRTGNQWGCNTYGITPDIINCAKALSAAVQPISATIINERIYQSMRTQADNTGSFFHGYTYGGHPVTCAVAVEVLKIYDEIDMLGHVRAVAPAFAEAIHSFRDHPMVGDTQAVGLIGAIEVVSDKATREMYGADAKVMEKLEANATKQGVILRVVKNRFAFSPPLVITEAEIAELFTRIRAALDDTWAEVKQG